MPFLPLRHRISVHNFRAMASVVLPNSESGSVLRRSMRLLRTRSATSVGTATTEESPSSSFLDQRHNIPRAVKDNIQSNLKQAVSPGSDNAELETLQEEEKIARKGKPKNQKQKPKSDIDGDGFVPEKQPGKKRQPKPEPVYIIPDVERKETNFKGRLGYTCLNTVLRSKKPASDSVFCSRTCRLDSIKKKGIDWVKELGRQNIRDLIVMIQWNEDHHIRFLRVSSEMFPFASHEKYGYPLDYCADLLKGAGDLANKYGHRLTTHPGQYTQLGSPKSSVISAAVRELDYHCEMLDLMGIGPDGVMIVHGGGTYGDKLAAIERMKGTISRILKPKVRARLVLENDEMCYNAEELLTVCEELDVPLVFDYHHDILNPSSTPASEIIRRADAIWRRRGIRPKQHLSEPRPGAETLMERRAHADRCESLPADLPVDMDLMIEAKDKEQAVFHLYRMYNLAPVIHDSLRPPNPNPTKETGGRKSSKAAKSKASKLEEPLENDEEATYIQPRVGGSLDASPPQDPRVEESTESIPVHTREIVPKTRPAHRVPKRMRNDAKPNEVSGDDRGKEGPSLTKRARTIKSRFKVTESQ